MAMRHLGQYRNVTLDEAHLDGRIIKTLFRRGRQTSGVLAGHIGERMENPAFKAALERLASGAYGIIEIEPAYHGDSVRVRLTNTGDAYGLDLTCEEQIGGGDATTQADRAMEERIAKGKA